MIPLSLLAVSTTVAMLTAYGAIAQPAAGYPAKPIRMIVPFAPGGASDFVARIIQPKLSELLGQHLVVENRSGAAGNIGVEIAARATPDGYTVLLGNVGAMAINPSIFPDFKIKPLRDLICTTAIADLPGGLAVHPSIPPNTVTELIAYAKSRPGQLDYGSAGVSSAGSLSFEFLINKVGLDIQHIPYNGGVGAAMIALLGGEIKIVAGNMASFTPHLKSGKLKVIGVIAEKRLATNPEIPTLVESGFPELTNAAWQGVFVPVATPRPIVDKLYAALIKVTQDPLVVGRLAQSGAVTIANKSPEDCTAFVRRQSDFWAALIKRLGIKGG